MRFLVQVRLPHEPFNTAVRDGSIGAKIGRILEALKPEAVYFTELAGRRTGILILDLTDPVGMTTIAEPWFLTFGADVEFHPVMTPADLQRAELNALGKAWA